MKIATIVEGDGEVAALPLLLRRLQYWRTPQRQVEVLHPIRVRRDRFLNKDDEFRKYLLLAREKAGTEGWSLVLLDADDDCPAAKAREIIGRATAVMGPARFSAVLANREYEAWFIAAAASLEGFRGFSHAADDSTPAELPRDAKGWLRDRMSSRYYGETTDQPAFTAKFDLALAAAGSRSFRKLCDEWDRHMVVPGE